MKGNLAICLAILSIVTTVGPTCAAPITWEMSVGGNGHSYELIDATINWDGANAAAISAGGHLATITSAEENQFITNVLGNGISDLSSPIYYHWIGGYQPDGSVEPAGGWSWVT